MFGFLIVICVILVCLSIGDDKSQLNNEVITIASQDHNDENQLEIEDPFYIEKDPQFKILQQRPLILSKNDISITFLTSNAFYGSLYDFYKTCLPVLENQKVIRLEKEEPIEFFDRKGKIETGNDRGSSYIQETFELKVEHQTFNQTVYFLTIEKFPIAIIMTGVDISAVSLSEIHERISVKLSKPDCSVLDMDDFKPIIIDSKEYFIPNFMNQKPIQDGMSLFSQLSAGNPYNYSGIVIYSCPRKVLVLPDHVYEDLKGQVFDASSIEVIQEKVADKTFETGKYEVYNEELHFLNAINIDKPVPENVSYKATHFRKIMNNGKELHLIFYGVEDYSFYPVTDLITKVLGREVLY